MECHNCKSVGTEETRCSYCEAELPTLPCGHPAGCGEPCGWCAVIARVTELEEQLEQAGEMLAGDDA